VAAVVTVPLIWPVSLLNGALPVLSSVWMLDLPAEEKNQLGDHALPHQGFGLKVVDSAFLAWHFSLLWKCS
jgi:hypothetical protein